MSDRPQVLEVSSLDDRHPGCCFFERCGLAVALRLGFDPIRVPETTLRRRITVDRLRPRARIRTTETLEIGWTGLANFAERCNTLQSTHNSEDITELAAVGVMALFIHELEGGVVQTVLQIGQGGDYLVLARGRLKQVEVSGLLRDAEGDLSRARLAKKKRQVLTKARSGFTSVTTFLHQGDTNAHSYLHHVSRGRRPRRGQQ